MEHWKTISDFTKYEVSDLGRIRNSKTGRILAHVMNQYDVMTVGLMRDGEQCHRSVPLLVARAFIPQLNGRFDTPINRDGDRQNNHVVNLMWRPRWFAIQYNRQFAHQYENAILRPLRDKKTGELYQNSFSCAVHNGLIEKELVLSILNHTYVWPTYQEFEVVSE